ncbi:hypothetical protein ACH347_18190 [Saccharopolyspora sp. 5N102]|uniref:hypothetical protein n=1 Tax=Saccharopolyspora sp. 5N102 TaxID=3375155 RepID=UPI0037B98BCD
MTPLLLAPAAGAREWFRAWLQREHPKLVPSYARLYREGSYLPQSYQRDVLVLVADAKRRRGRCRPVRRGGGGSASAQPVVGPVGDGRESFREMHIIFDWDRTMLRKTISG